MMPKLDSIYNRSDHVDHNKAWLKVKTNYIKDNIVYYTVLDDEDLQYAINEIRTEQLEMFIQFYKLEQKHSCMYERWYEMQTEK